MLTAFLVVVASTASLQDPSPPGAQLRVSTSQTRLLTQSDVPLADDSAYLSRRLSRLTQQIDAVPKGWPWYAMTLGVVGYSVAGLGLGFGISFAVAGGVALPSSNGFGALGLIVWGVLLCGAGLVGLAIGIIGTVIGNNAEQRNDEQRGILVDERSLLEAQLKGAAVSSARREAQQAFDAAPLLTVARF